MPNPASGLSRTKSMAAACIPILRNRSSAFYNYIGVITQHGFVIRCLAIHPGFFVIGLV